MTSHAGGGEVGYKLAYILYCTGGWCGFKNNASSEMKNNVNPIVETVGWTGGVVYKAVQ